MKYLFVLGSNPALSLAELATVFDPSKIVLINNDLVLLDIPEIEPKEVIKNLGGIIKIAKLEDILSDHSQIKEKALELIKKKNPTKQGKTRFGLSPYGKGFKNINKLGLGIKKALKEENINSRLVTSQEKNLSSVVAETNRLTSSGIEILLTKHQNKILLGKTLAVQDFKELSFRDYSRPARDSHSGMLPPKLSQIMINMANSKKKTESKVILDPFCGSGTILTEASLMGYKNLIGSDSSDKAIRDSQENLEWVMNKYGLKGVNYRLENIKVSELTKVLKKESVDMVVTEPYLGPQRGSIKVEKVVKELEELYSEALKQFSKILKKEGRVVMIWPVFQNGTKTINPDTADLKITPLLHTNLKLNQGLDLTDRNTIIYFRKGQRVWREIVALEK